MLSGVSDVSTASRSSCGEVGMECGLLVLYTDPDCVEKLVPAINGQSPSPTIFAVEGDTVEVKLTSLILTEGVLLHWHGILQVRVMQPPQNDILFDISLSCRLLTI